MLGDGVIWLIFGIIVLVGGVYVIARRLVMYGLFGLGAILVWLVLVVFIITYAEQHDDPWELYVSNTALAVSSAAAGFLASLAVIREKLQSLNQRFDDHINAEARAFEQFEKRILEKLEDMDAKIDGLSNRRKS